MGQVNIYEAKTHLSSLLRRVKAGEEVVIAEAGKPVARLVPIATTGPRVLGGDEGKIFIADDFDASLPDEIIDAFYDASASASQARPAPRRKPKTRRK